MTRKVVPFSPRQRSGGENLQDFLLQDNRLTVQQRSDVASALGAFLWWAAEQDLTVLDAPPLRPLPDQAAYLAARRQYVAQFPHYSGYVGRLESMLQDEVKATAAAALGVARAYAAYIFQQLLAAHG